MNDIVVVGGGVIGMLTARELADAGASVTLIERGHCAAEASWAGGGIVSPLYPWRYNDAVTALASHAQRSYPRLCADLYATTGIDPEFEPCGLLMLEADDAEQALAWSDRSQRPMQAVSRDFIHNREPALASEFERGLWMPDVANVRNPRLGQALRAALLQAENVEVREGLTVDGFDCHGGAVSAVRACGSEGVERIPAEHFVICAGAWSERVLRPLGLHLPVEPVKGQMLLYELEAPMLSGIVLYKGRYLIPRRDHHLLVGSTLEHCGFDKQLSESALHSLRESACEMLPLLEKHTVKKQWAGLRPGAPDGVPFIGRLPGFDNLFVNAGHYRNGLVLAPASARLASDIVSGREPDMDPTPYEPAARMRSA